MDSTILNLISILISATGIFGAFTSYSVPELNKTYYGHNAFKIKADVISTTYTWLFALLVVVGLFILAAKEVLYYDLPARDYSTAFYLRFLCFGLAAMAILAWLIVMLGRTIAKRLWRPKMVKSQREAYHIAQYIYANDGWAENDIEKKQKYDDPEAIKAVNYQRADKYIEHICKLFEIKTANMKSAFLLKRLKIYFE